MGFPSRVRGGVNPSPETGEEGMEDSWTEVPSKPPVAQRAGGIQYIFNGFWEAAGSHLHPEITEKCIPNRINISICFFMDFGSSSGYDSGAQNVAKMSLKAYLAELEKPWFRMEGIAKIGVGTLPCPPKCVQQIV